MTLCDMLGAFLHFAKVFPNVLSRETKSNESLVKSAIDLHFQNTFGGNNTLKNVPKPREFKERRWWTYYFSFVLHN